MIPLRDDVPSRITPAVNVAVIVLCILAFMWQLSLGSHGFQAAVYSFGLIPATLLGDARLPPDLYAVPPVATVFTSMFLHGGLLHLAGNMLYLWIFGDNVEDSMGHGRYALFYLACGVVAAMAQALTNPGAEVPMIGASGAISGVLGAYLLLYPHARVLVIIPLGLLFPIVHLPAVLVLGLWFAIQILSSLLAAPGASGVAFSAHVGGFVAGMLLIPLFRYRRFPLFGRPRSRGQ
jgi:membrane associated rhomboid family serine protease